MILLINTSTLSGTGVCQVATSFIYECRYFKNNYFHVFLSRTMCKNITRSDFGDNFIFYEISSHPIYGIKGYIEKKRMKELEKKIKPDCVFSVFGPSCWTPHAPHLIGYALGHYVYPESPVYTLMTWRERTYRNLLKIFHRYFLLRDGDYYVCETDDVSERLCTFLKIKRDVVFTVGNGCNHYFLNFSSNNNCILPAKNSNEFRFLSLCSPYKHKNLTILNLVIPMLLKRRISKDFKFVVTMDNDDYINNFSNISRKYMINVGVLAPEECPQLYSECDALFLPTLLECFSANYPEAMYMGKPILTSNLSFATSVCGEAALYFDPLDPIDITNKIEIILSSENKIEELIQKGLIKCKSFNTSFQRANEYINICGRISMCKESNKK